eukprot:503264_1
MAQNEYLDTTADTKKNNNEQKDKDIKNIVIPIKSELDKRDYRIITLRNNLEAILISDKNTKKASCAIAVGVGYFEDPLEIPGLAHFLEHMLFLGTQKYPKENQYHEFIQNHGGIKNALTSTDKTIYNFDISHEYLKQAIDIFSQFFISPLFTESATNRELNAVNAEHSKNLQDDTERLWQFDASLALNNHPFNKFGTGNLNTLTNDKLRQYLIEFYSKYYSSSIMKLVIYGKESLNELQNIVLDNFLLIKNNGNNMIKYSENVFDLNKFPLLYKIIPIKQNRILRICWVMKSIQNKEYHNSH